MGEGMMSIKNHDFAIKKFLEGLKNGNLRIIEISYDDLKTLLSNDSLIPGNYYKIKDFQTAYNIYDAGTSTIIETKKGVIEPLLVLATSKNQFNQNAISLNYPKDIIYYTPELLDTRDIAYANTKGLPVPEYKGHIYFRHDTIQNVSTWYDFRNITFRRWGDALEDWTDDNSGKYSDLMTFGEHYNKVKDVHIGRVDLDTFGDCTTLNNIVFKTTTSEWSCSGNNIGPNSVRCTINATEFENNICNKFFSDNKIRGNFVGNTMVEMSGCTIEHYFRGNEMHRAFKNNIIAGNCKENTFGAYFIGNTIGYEFTRNYIGAHSSNNNFGSFCTDNEFGSFFSANTIGTRCAYNEIESYCQSNTIGTYFNRNEIRVSFQRNHIANYFQRNEIKDDFKDNTISKDNFQYNNIQHPISETDFSLATHVYAEYTCELFNSKESGQKLSYKTNLSVEITNITE